MTTAVKAESETRSAGEKSDEPEGVENLRGIKKES
jgi:hypothetical protein